MTAGRFLASSLTLAMGSAVVAGLYWALVNVPESNLLALALSAALVVATFVALGVTVGMAIMFAQGARLTDAGRRAIAALPAFFLGLAVFGTLWWTTGAADSWWTGHRGEVDAVFMRYAGTARTERLHQAVFWLTFLVRWALGVSVVAGLVAAAGAGGAGAVRRGLRLSLRLAPLAASMAGVVIVSEGLWRAVYWRPENLPPTSAETLFVAAKLLLLYVAAAGVGASVLAFFRPAPARVI